jgi:archaellum component FlaC
MKRKREEWIKRQECYGLDEFEQRKTLSDWQESDEKKDAEIEFLQSEVALLKKTYNQLFDECLKRGDEIVALEEQVKKLKAMLEMLEPGSPYL